MVNYDQCTDRIGIKDGSGPGIDLNRQLTMIELMKQKNKNRFSEGISTLPSNQTTLMKLMNVVNPIKAPHLFQKRRLKQSM